MLIQLSDFVKELRCGKYIKSAVQIVKNVQCRFDDTLKATKTARMTRAVFGRQCPRAFDLVTATTHYRRSKALFALFVLALLIRNAATCLAG